MAYFSEHRFNIGKDSTDISAEINNGRQVIYKCVLERQLAPVLHRSDLPSVRGALTFSLNHFVSLLFLQIRPSFQLLFYFHVFQGSFNSHDIPERLLILCFMSSGLTSFSVRPRSTEVWFDIKEQPSIYKTITDLKSWIQNKRIFFGEKTQGS